MTWFGRLILVFAALVFGLNKTAAQRNSTLIALPSGWRLASELMNGFPSEGLQIYALETTAPATPAKVYCVAWDTTAPTVTFKPVLSATPRTLTQFAAAETGNVYAAINAGFFGGNQSFSLVQYAGTVLAANVKSVTRPLQGASANYFPTRAAFGITSSGRLTTDWIYNIGGGISSIVAYPSPSPNRPNDAPQPVPTANFPAGGVPWIMEHAIGGSPMLIKDGEVRVTDQEELIDINNTTARARSAIGYTASGIVLLVAAEGDNSPGPAGFNLVQFAGLLRSLGCVGAVNLDGGGSTSLVVGGRRTVRPSDGNERPVISALLLIDPQTQAPAATIPMINHQPWDLAVSAGASATLQVAASGGGLSYQWTARNAPIPGATQASFTVTAATPADAGTYDVTISNGLGTITSKAVALSVINAPPAELANLSTRADSGLGADVLIGGFVVRSGSGNILARGVGPGLAQLGVTGFLVDPQIELLTGSGTSLATNDNWDAPSVGPVAASTGAFPLAVGSRDAALVRTIQSGPHVVVAGAADRTSSGNTLIEIYDTRMSPGVLTNLSARARVQAVGGRHIAGFVVRGEAAITVLIRAIGPALASLGVAAALPSTRISLVQDGQIRFTNTGWATAGNALAIREAARQTGAFGLVPGSADSALLVTLQPGAYTAVVDSPAGAGGVALVEVYEVR